MRKIDPQQASRQQLPLPEVARRLRLPFSRVLSLVRSHELEAHLVGGARWFVSPEALVRFRARERAA